MIISQIVRISEVCDQNANRVSKNDKISHICSMCVQLNMKNMGLYDAKFCHFLTNESVSTSHRSLAGSAKRLVHSVSTAVSSLHWLFSRFLCCFSSTEVYSEYTSSFLLRHRYLFSTFQKVRGPATYQLRLYHCAGQV